MAFQPASIRTLQKLKGASVIMDDDDKVSSSLPKQNPNTEDLSQNDVDKLYDILDKKDNDKFNSSKGMSMFGSDLGHPTDPQNMYGSQVLEELKVEDHLSQEEYIK